MELAERRADHAGAADRDADEVGEVARHELLRLGDLDPALRGQRGRVDEVDLLLGVAREHAVERRQREQARVAPRQVAEVLALDAGDVAVGERGGEAAEALHERQVGPEHLHVVGRHRGDVHGGRDDAAGERGDHLLGGLDAGAVLGLGGRGAEVRGDDDVVVAVEQRVVGDRLGREDVERGAGDLAGVERVLERLVDQQLAAGAVDDADAVLHLGERLGVEPAARLGRLGQVDGDEVGLAVDVGARLGLLGPELAEAFGGDERVVGEHAHAEALRAGGDELADAAEAEHAERLLVDLDAAELRALPLVRGEAGVGLRDVARQREHQRDGVLGGGDDVGLGRVGDDDAALGGGLHVDVVDADAGAPDHAQVVGAADQVRGQLRRRADQDPVVVADALRELLVGPVDADVDRKALAQHVHAGVGDLLLDEDLVLLLEH